MGKEGGSCEGCKSLINLEYISRIVANVHDDLEMIREKN